MIRDVMDLDVYILSLRLLKMAIGSSDEIISHLRTVAIAVPRLIDEAKELAEDYQILSKRLNKLHSVWRSGSF